MQLYTLHKCENSRFLTEWQQISTSNVDNPDNICTCRPIHKYVYNGNNKKLSCRRDRATLHVIEYFAKSLKSFMACVNPYWYFIETMYVVPFTRYSALKNGVTLKLRVGSLKVTENGAVRKITHDFLSVGHSKYIRSCMLYHFQVIWRWIIVTFKRSLKVIQTDTIQKLGCSFLFTFDSK